MYEKLVFEFPMENNEVVAEGDDPGFVLKPQAYFRGPLKYRGRSSTWAFRYL